MPACRLTCDFSETGPGRVIVVWCVEQTRLERREVVWFQLA
jgi:hypothetical protein